MGITAKLDTESVNRTFGLLRRFAPELRTRLLSDWGESLLDILRAGVPQRYVTRKAAYGKTFFTEKQRRWFFANDMQNQIPYRRTGAMAVAWHKEQRGEDVYLVNNAPGVGYVMGDATQSRHEAMVGWNKISVTIRENQPRMIQIARSTLRYVARKLGLA